MDLSASTETWQLAELRRARTVADVLYHASAVMTHLMLPDPSLSLNIRNGDANVKVFSKILVAAMMALTGTLMTAQLPTPQAGPVEVSIDAVTLADVSSDRVRFDVQSHVTATRSLKIKQVRFEHMRLGHLPVYLGPLQQSLTLEKGNALNLPSIPLTIYFRDLDSLEPLEEVVRNQEAVVEGNARVDLGLSLERILGGVAHADVPVKVTTPVEIPGGVLGQAAALATLGTAQIALDLAWLPPQPAAAVAEELGGGAADALHSNSGGCGIEVRATDAE